MDIKIHAEDLPEMFSGFLEIFNEDEVTKIALRFAGEAVYFQKLEWIKAHISEDIEPYKTILSIGGEGKLFQTAKIYGGQMIYFPVADSLYRSSRNRRIRKEFNGYNIKRLAKKYGMSDMGIRQIVGGAEIRRKKNEPDKNQISIFDVL